jgi:hypothetical protein
MYCLNASSTTQFRERCIALAKAANFSAISGAVRTVIVLPAIMDLLDYCIANTSIHTMIAHEYSRNIETLAAHPESRINAPTPT